jgi:hypothetical protein
MDKENQSLKKEIDLFTELHHIEAEYRIEESLISLLEYNMFNETIIPDLIIYNSDKLNKLIPLLQEIKRESGESYPDASAYTVNGKVMALPFQISRPLLLQGSSGGENELFASDFGDINLLYPLFIRFGMGTDLDLRSNAFKDSFYYLTGLYRQGILKLSSDQDRDFIEGSIDNVYTSSQILGKITGDLKEKEKRIFPQLGGVNPPPLMHYTFLSIPGSSRNTQYSHELLHYLTDFGVQQRINPRSGYLPYNQKTYHLLNDSMAKMLMIEDLDKAFWLPPAESLDRLRFAIPRIYRLVITGRFTIEEGISEIINYVAESGV